VLVKTQVKYIQSLGQKKFRDATNQFVAEGSKIINELLVSPNVETTALFATASWIARHGTEIGSLPNDIVHEIKESTFNSISQLKTPGEVLGVFKKPEFGGIDVRKSICLMLDEIQDPGNLGSIIRTADWFHIQKIFCSKGCADAFNPKVIQASMGSIARVEVIVGDLESLLNEFHDVPAYAAVLEGANIFQLEPIDSGFIIIGNESKGIRSELLGRRIEKITIPGGGHAESLNAAIAAGIFMALLVGRSQ